MVCHLEASKKFAASASQQGICIAAIEAIKLVAVAIIMIGVLVQGIYAQPNAPLLVSPSNGASGQSHSSVLTWSSVTGALSYRVQVSTDQNFGSTIFNQNDSVATAQMPGDSVAGRVYYWRTNAISAGGSSSWSGVWSFITTHFNVRYNTGNNMTVFVLPATPPNITIDDSTLQIGDEIGAFNQAGLCVGAAVWTGSNTYLTVWGNPPYFNGSATTPDEYGMQVGEVMQYRIWRAFPSNPIIGREAVAMPTYAPVTVMIQESSPTYSKGNVEAFATLTGVSIPTLVSPSNGAVGQALAQTLTWTSLAGATSYAVQVSTNVNFATTLFAEWGPDLTSSSAALMNLSNTTTYYWRVGAKNGSTTGGVSGWSTPASFVTIGVAPTIVSPQNDAVGQGIKPILTWSTVVGATSYAVQVSTGQDFASTVFAQLGSEQTLPLVTVSGLANAKTYYWRVNGQNSSITGGNSGWSGISTFTTIGGVPILNSPVNNSEGMAITQTLEWASVTGATGYAVQVSTNANFASTVFAMWGSELGSTSATVSGLANGATYYWHAGAKNSGPTGGMSGWSATWTFGTIAIPVLISPANDTVGPALTQNLEWTSVAGASSYAVQVSTSSNFATTVYAQWRSPATSLTLPALATQTTYFWRAGAKNSTANGGISGWSSVWTFTTSHFTTQYNTGSNMTVFILPSAQGNFTIDDSALQRDDEIGAFNQAGLCVGAAVWSGSNTYITVWGNPLYFNGIRTTQDEYGIEAGEVIQYRIWRSSPSHPSFGREAAATPAYAPATGIIQESSPTYTTGNIEALATLTGVSTPTLSSPLNGACAVALSPTLDWTTEAGATSYAVEVSSDAKFGSTVFSETGISADAIKVSGRLSNNSTYVWRSNASIGNATSNWSLSWSFTTIAVPVLSSPSDNAQGQVPTPVLTWETVSGATGYAVQISTDLKFATTVFSEIGISADPTNVGASVSSGLAHGITYYWHAGAKNSGYDGGVSGWSATWTFTTIGGAPVLSLPSNDAQGQILMPVLTWGTVSEATSYAVQISTDVNFANTVFSQIGISANSNYESVSVSSELANGITYFWRAGAKNSSYNGGVSGWATAWTFTTIGGPPLLSSPSNNALGQMLKPVLTWATVSGATSYAVQVSTDVNFGSTVFSEIGISASATDVSAIVSSGLSHDITYYWHAGAKNSSYGGGESGWSPTWSFMTIALTTLNLPLDSQNVTLPPVLSWSAEINANSYKLEVSTSMSFSTTVFSQGGLTGTSDTMNSLSNGQTYFWRVGAKTPTGISGWSNIWSFITASVQAIKLAQNWNIKSINLHSLDSSLSVMIGSPEDFIAIKDIYGHDYIPSFGINQLGTWSTGMGYQIYSQYPDTFMVTGFPVNAASTPISLEQSWNIIAFLPNYEMNIDDALASIANQIFEVKNNAGEAYIPSLGINQIGNMEVGEGYMIYATQAVTFTYPSGNTGVGKGRLNSFDVTTTLKGPVLKHYRISMNTGNNATYIGKQVSMGGHPVPDSCEIGAFNVRGKLVGSGSVMCGKCVFTVWGNDQHTKRNDGCAINETITLKLWDGQQEYPLEFIVDNNSPSRYMINGILIGTFIVPEESSIKTYDLSKVFPNPFKDHINIAFDVPSMNGTSLQDIEINVFDFKGTLVHTLAKGKYAAGHYVLSWDFLNGRDGYQSSEIYVIQMKAQKFEKRVKVIRIR